MTMNAGNPAAEAAGSAAATTDDVQSQLETTDTEETPEDTSEGSETASKEQTDELTDDDLKAIDGEGDDFIEVEGDDGKLHKLPKAVQGRVMSKKDYTQKTQAIADTRRELEAREKRNTELVQAASKTIQERAQLSALDMKIEELQKAEAEYQQLDWNALFAEVSTNPEAKFKYDQLQHNHAQLRRQMEQLFGKRHGLANQIQKTEQEQIQAQRTEFAKRQGEARKVIESQIPGWNTERDAQMVTGAGEFYGLTREQLLVASADPSLYRVVWDAVQLRTLLKARANKPKPPVKPADTIAPEPAAKVTQAGPSGRAGPRPGMSPEEWIKARNKQLAERDKRAR